ncbi:MAG: hypothetical protein FWB73_02560 [Treponema sp.]|nr:hypothetical protein [Treponema sp.]
MKKTKIIFFAIIAIFITGLFMISCTGNIPESKQEETDDDENDQPAGGILILQAYASSSGAAGATHSFVELYNTSKEAIELDGIFLYFADGHKQGAGTDSQWDRITLTGTIPAEGSFLIMGPKQNNTLAGTAGAARYQIEDDYGDIIDPNFTISNRAFKAALIKGTIDLNARNIQNPFDTDGEGTKVKGYIDMVGAVNDPAANDAVLGFETAPARCSASEAVRRKNLTDTDNNQGVSEKFPDGKGDFDSIRYSQDGIGDELLELRKPRNSSEGKWNPFEEPPPPENPTTAGEKSEYAGKLLILQAGASTDGAITRSFVELYNNTDAAIDLNTFSLQYGAVGVNWNVINLTGTIPAKGSYLITGSLGEITDDSRLYFEDADQTVDAFALSNNGFKVALMENQNKLTVENPFAMTEGTAADYVDMLGAFNNSASSVDAFETTAFTAISKQAAARRKSLTDSDNNQTDFERIDYRTSGVNEIRFDQVKPRYSADGEWSPFPKINLDWPTGTPKLMILQANTHGNADGGFSKSLVELYNNTNVNINLDTDGYYLHIGENATPGWTNVFKLTGTIPAYSSFVIISNNTAGTTTPRTTMPAADREYDFVLTNSGFKVALMINQSALLTVANPFTEVSLSDDYIDMLGVTNTATGFETAFANQSKPQLTRRNSLTDTNNNSVDFSRIDIRSTAMQDSELYKYWPRNSASGAWNPMTGDSITQP